MALMHDSDRTSAAAHPAAQPTATVLSIQRMSTEDGPGIRTTVFLKGCSLACQWCHNPESIDGRPQILWNRDRCIGCGTCATQCPRDALTAAQDGICIDRQRCTACGSCSEQCPTLALERLGQPWTVAALLSEVAKDRSFYEQSGGGVTLSGGEPVLQRNFIVPFLQACRQAELATALDTCGQCHEKALLAAAAHCDLILFDLKIDDSQSHQVWTGQPNATILRNLRALADWSRSQTRPPALWIRTPLIPQATATAENIAAIGRLLAQEFAGLVSRWDLCAFNNLCREQYRRLGLTWRFATTDLLTPHELAFFADHARRSGVDPAIVQVSGATRLATEGRDI